MTNQSTNEHMVVIFKDDREIPPYCVAPGRLIVKTGSTVRFHNATTSRAELVFSDNSPFGEGFELDQGQLSSAERLDKVGVYPYQVSVAGQMAQGSRPIIIVYP